MKVILFSPTGGTKKVADAICKGIGEEVSVIDFCNREKRNEKIKCEEGELALIAFPVFGDRIPALAAQRLKEVEANGAKDFPIRQTWKNWKPSGRRLKAPFRRLLGKQS